MYIYTSQFIIYNSSFKGTFVPINLGLFKPSLNIIYTFELANENTIIMTIDIINYI